MDYNRKYKCKYCSYVGNREQLVNHIEEQHSEYVNDEWPAARIVYNHLNGVECGHCIICGKPTEWNDKTWKYKRHCGSKRCKDAIRDRYRKNAVAARGKYNFTDDSAHLEKMLAGRKISGVYTCSDGSKKTYTGSYERKAIEFMDKVLKCDPEDILMPGPIFEYEYNGETHRWITDIYYVPYNLVIEVKDGGDNPNNRTMVEYRAKQEAKEKAIIKDGTYNYLRLTNNSFVQLMQMFSALRLAMINDEDKTRKAIIQINESTAFDDIHKESEIMCTAEPNMALLFIYDDEVCEKASYIGLTDLSSNYCLIPTMEGKLESVNKGDLVSAHKGTVISKQITVNESRLATVVEAFQKGKFVGPYTIYKMITGAEYINDTSIFLAEAAGDIVHDCVIESDTLRIYVENALDEECSGRISVMAPRILNDAEALDKCAKYDISLMENEYGYYLRSNNRFPVLASEIGDYEDIVNNIDYFGNIAMRYGGKTNG